LMMNTEKTFKVIVFFKKTIKKFSTPKNLEVPSHLGVECCNPKHDRICEYRLWPRVANVRLYWEPNDISKNDGTKADELYKKLKRNKSYGVDKTAFVFIKPKRIA
jgi:hypothetical protein